MVAGEDTLVEKLIALGNLSVLADVSISRDKLLSLFSSKIHSLFGARALAVWMYDRKEDTISLDFYHGLEQDIVKNYINAVPAEQFPEIKFCLDSNTVWTTEDIEDSQLFEGTESDKIIESLNATSIMGVPLRALKETIGALSFYYGTHLKFQ